MKIVSKAISLVDVEQRIIQWKLQNGELQPLKDNILKSKLKWTGTAADLVEFTYGAVDTKRLNNGDIDLNDAVAQLCILFSFEVKDCYDTFRAIRRRVDSRTFFLDEMIDKLNERMDNMDNGIYRKKKNRRKSNE